MQVLRFVKKFRKDTEGATMIEYALIAALISIAAITALQAMKPKIAATFDSVNTALPAAQ